MVAWPAPSANTAPAPTLPQVVPGTAGVTTKVSESPAAAAPAVLVTVAVTWLVVTPLPVMAEGLAATLTV